MVKQFRMRHESHFIDSGMYDDGYETMKEDNWDGKQKRHSIADEMDYPNIESPRMTNEILKERMIIPNRKVNRDSDDDYNVGTELEPEITNVPNPTIERKDSNLANQGDYEIIGDNQWRNTAPLKAKFGEECKEGNRSMSMNVSWKYSLNIPLVAKTDKGFSEISQQNKKSLGALVSGKFNDFVRFTKAQSKKMDSSRSPIRRMKYDWILLDGK